MATDFSKNHQVLSLEAFLALANDIQSFASWHGTRYRVYKIKHDIMYLVREDVRDGEVCPLDLFEVYEAYRQLDDFSALQIKRFVPELPAAARGLLLYLGMLE